MAFNIMNTGRNCKNISLTQSGLAILFQPFLGQNKDTVDQVGVCQMVSKATTVLGTTLLISFAHLEGVV